MVLRREPAIPRNKFLQFLEEGEEGSDHEEELDPDTRVRSDDEEEDHWVRGLRARPWHGMHGQGVNAIHSCRVVVLPTGDGGRL